MEYSGEPESRKRRLTMFTNISRYCQIDFGWSSDQLGS